MENIYDIRLKENLLFILPLEGRKASSVKIFPKKVAVAVNLFYPDTIEQFMRYINQIPQEIDIYIFSSSKDVLATVEEIRTRKMFLCEKENRGRDVSALLVAFREYALQYEYICFVHDKKANFSCYKEDVKVWIRNLWENVIGSEDYIFNVFQSFEKNEEIGLIVPPEPIGDYFTTWYTSGWGNNYENTKSLVAELKLNCNLDEEKSPLTFGTVFWARTAAIKKLLLKDWKYEDFPEEPMAIDDTISHAIERSFGFVAQDAGYKIATIMSDSYAAWSLLFVQDSSKKMWNLVVERLKMYNTHQIKMLEKQECYIREFCESNEEIYLYGAGVFGKDLLWHMKNWGLKPNGFVVSNGKRTESMLEGYPVMELRELAKKDTIGIIIAVKHISQDAMEQILKEEGFTNYIRGYI